MEKQELFLFIWSSKVTNIILNDLPFSAGNTTNFNNSGNTYIGFNNFLGGCTK